MKISHSIIALTALIYLTGSMLSVGMDLKSSTDNISTNVIEAKYKYNEEKETYLDGAKNEAQVINKESSIEAKKMYKVKLQMLNQNDTAKSKNRTLSGKTI